HVLVQSTHHLRALHYFPTRRSSDLPRRAQPDRFRETEIDHFDVAVRPDHDVSGLQVTMNNSSSVSGHQGRGNLASDIDRKAQAKDRKSTRLNSSHDQISYAVFCLKK